MRGPCSGGGRGKASRHGSSCSLCRLPFNSDFWHIELACVHLHLSQHSPVVVGHLVAAPSQQGAAVPRGKPCGALSPPPPLTLCPSLWLAQPTPLCLATCLRWYLLGAPARAFPLRRAVACAAAHPVCAAPRCRTCAELLRGAINGKDTSGAEFQLALRGRRRQKVLLSASLRMDVAGAVRMRILGAV